MGLRDMTWGSGAYGAYMSSASSAPLKTKFFMFGPKEWSYKELPFSKELSVAIRPVLVSDDGQEDPVYSAFANIK